MNSQLSRSQPHIHVHIERLVLDGLPIQNSDAPRIQAAVEAELSRLLAGAGKLPAGGAIATVRGGEVRIAPGQGPVTLGAQIARAVNQSIKGATTCHSS